MGKTFRKLGLGLALGAAAGHYLSTDKGQKFLAQVKKGLAAYQEDPAYYQGEARAFIDQQLERFKAFVAEDSPVEKVTPETAAHVDDIIITYTEDDLV